MPNFMQPDEQTTRLATIPSDLPILPLRSTLAYPFSVMPLAIGIPRSMRLIEDALQGDRLIGLVGIPDAKVEEPLPGQMYETGTMAISKCVTDPGQYAAGGRAGHRALSYRGVDPDHALLTGSYHLASDIVESDVELEALQGTCASSPRKSWRSHRHVPRELRDFLGQVHDPRLLAYMVAAIARLQVSEVQRFWKWIV